MSAFTAKELEYLAGQRPGRPHGGGGLHPGERHDQTRTTMPRKSGPYAKSPSGDPEGLFPWGIDKWLAQAGL